MKNIETKKIVIAGGSGLLGKCIIRKYKSTNHQLIVLSRMHREDYDNVDYVKWDGKTIGEWANILENADALINLSGKSVDCRYHEKNKQLIYNSRIEATQVLGKAIMQCKYPPKVWINASSATIYRHALDRPMDELTGELGTGFSVDVCKKWEKTFNEVTLPNTRKVLLRIAIVLSKRGGAFMPLGNLAKLGFGGKQGNGRQYISWLHETDFTNIIDFVINNSRISGVYNAAAPHPIPNHEFMHMLRKAHSIQFGFPLHKWMLEMGALLVQTETELILKSRRVIPKKLLDQEFNFQYENIKEAITDLVSSTD